MQAASQRAKRSIADRFASDAPDADGAGNILKHRPISMASRSDDVVGPRDDERFLREKLYRIQGIRHTRSTISLRTLKLVTSADPLLVNASG
jgi:hypothetical protein